MKKRILACLLALVMLLSLLPTAVFAATPKAKLVTDASELKAGDQMEWVGRMNSCRDRATEIVYHQVIYT